MLTKAQKISVSSAYVSELSFGMPKEDKTFDGFDIIKIKESASIIIGPIIVLTNHAGVVK